MTTPTRPECDTCHKVMTIAQAVVMVVAGVTYVMCLDCTLFQLEDFANGKTATGEQKHFISLRTQDPLQIRDSAKGSQLHSGGWRRDSSRHKTSSPQRSLRVCGGDLVCHSGREGRRPKTGGGPH